MCIPSLYKKCLKIFSFTCLLFILDQNLGLAQGQSAEVKGYDKASYSVSQSAKYMHTWLVAGPVTIAIDSAKPNDSEQVRIFKSDIITQVNNSISFVVKGKYGTNKFEGRVSSVFYFARIAYEEYSLNNRICLCL